MLNEELIAKMREVEQAHQEAVTAPHEMMAGVDPSRKWDLPTQVPPQVQEYSIEVVGTLRNKWTFQVCNLQLLCYDESIRIVHLQTED